MKSARRFSTCAAILLLAGCANSNATYNEDNIVNFSDFGVTRLDVAKITIDDTYVPTLRSPNVEHEFPVPLYQAVHRWGENRFQAVGTGGEAHVIIKDASVKREMGPVDYDKYIARVVVRLNIDSPYYAPEAYAEVVVTQTTSIGSDASEDSRNDAYNKMEKQIIETLNAKMTESVQKNLYPVIK